MDDQPGRNRVRDTILAAVGQMDEQGLPPEDIADGLLVIGANAVIGLVGKERAAAILMEMSKEFWKSVMN